MLPAESEVQILVPDSRPLTAVVVEELHTPAKVVQRIPGVVEVAENREFVRGAGSDPDMTPRAERAIHQIAKIAKVSGDLVRLAKGGGIWCLVLMHPPRLGGNMPLLVELVIVRRGELLQIVIAPPATVNAVGATVDRIVGSIGLISGTGGERRLHTGVTVAPWRLCSRGRRRRLQRSRIPSRRVGANHDPQFQQQVSRYLQAGQQAGVGVV